ncbi:MAG: DUF421 domain-containing protein [Clostridiales bacterium]|nr:DUF421 domain-containing protein [Clostridiales bacterium]
MDYAKIAFSALFSIIVIFFITKLLGNKQLSQLKMFDYVNGITIGSIAAELATELETPLYPLIALGVYLVVSLIISFTVMKSLSFRRVVDGDPTVLMQSGKLIKANFKRAKVDLNDFMERCRVMGYFDLTDIELAVLEISGQLSILPKESARPTVLSDIKEPETVASASIGVIYDGQIIHKNLKATGHETSWLERQVQKQGYKIKDVFLATCDNDNNLRVFPSKDEKTNSFFTM